MENINQLLLTCEHAGNEVPEEYEELFFPYRSMLNSHRGYDPGAFTLAKGISFKLACPLISSSITRLLVDCNRSIDNQELYSEISWPLSISKRNEILRKFYHPYRSLVVEKIKERIHRFGSCVHISVHSFTPILNHQIRICDIGILYDDDRREEDAFCNLWREKLQAINPEWIIRFNYPYLGKDDGFTTFLRKSFPAGYLGIELEVNQSLLIQNTERYTRAVSDSLRMMISNVAV